jgi:hypothetical protein
MIATAIVRKDLPIKDPAAPSSPALADADVSTLTLVGRTAQINIGPAITTCQLERTIDGASTLTASVNDPHLAILNSPAIQGANPGDLHAEAVLDNLAFALAMLNLQSARQLQLILEDDAIHALRQYVGALTMTRSSHNTRARFLKRLCDDAKVEFVCPEMEKQQPIQTQAQAAALKSSKARKPGISATASLTVKNVPITPNQRAEAETVLSVGASLNAGALPALASICAAIGESTLGGDASAYRPNSAGYYGVLQGSDKTWPDPHDTAGMAHSFFLGGKGYQAGGAIALARTVTDPGEIATRVEASGELPAFYGVWSAEAQKIVNAYTGSSSGVLSAGSVTEPYQFSRGANEDSWTCARRLADEVQWYLFALHGAIHFYSPSYLMASKIQMLVAPAADGIDEVTFNYATSPKHADTITVTCRAGVWQCEPGAVAEVEGYGPADGRWLTTDIVRASMASATTTVTLGRPQTAVAEPLADASATVSGTSVAAITTKDGLSTPSTAWNPVRKPIANWIVPILTWAAAHGWGGAVTSGYRTQAEEQAAAVSYGLNKYGPGGPANSNHCKIGYPGGAVDVTDYVQLASVLKGYPSTPNLVWGGTTIEDAVHFSATGR